MWSQARILAPGAGGSDLAAQLQETDAFGEAGLLRVLSRAGLIQERCAIVMAAGGPAHFAEA